MGETRRQFAMQLAGAGFVSLSMENCGAGAATGSLPMMSRKDFKPAYYDAGAFRRACQSGEGS